jgi:hypothetical protein
MPQDILDQTVRDWIAMAIGQKKDCKLSVTTNEVLMEHLRATANRQRWTLSKTAHLSIMFGLAALTQYFNEQEGSNDELEL